MVGRLQRLHQGATLQTDGYDPVRALFQYLIHKIDDYSTCRYVCGVLDTQCCLFV
jgi:hypothetical protein